VTETLTEAAWLARILRPQGRKGEVYASLLTDFPDKFAERKRLWLLPSPESASAIREPRQVLLLSHWLHKGGIVLHFEGVDSISAAEQLSHLIVAIPRAERAPLGDDEVYIDDLDGCTLIDLAPPTPVTVGVVIDVDRGAGPVPLLVVRGEDGEEILVPFAKNYLKKIDLPAKRLEMALPDGLLELNR